MPALQPITRTEIAHDPEASRFFPARFAGTCAWTGLPFQAGELVKRYLGVYVRRLARMRANDRRTEAAYRTGARTGGRWGC